MRHIACLHWQALIYNLQMTLGWKQIGIRTIILAIHVPYQSMRLASLLHTTSIHFIQWFRHLLVYYSLRQAGLIPHKC